MIVPDQPRVALAHHWLVTTRGGEKVVEALAELFPRADLFTLVCDSARLSPALRSRPIHTSFLQRFPQSSRRYPYFLPIYPWATRRLDVSGYPLVISSDAATVKGVRVDRDAIHICYCHTPMRYVWSSYETYRRAVPPLARTFYPLLASWLRSWDRRAAQSVTHFVANSQHVAERIRRFYDRQSAVIYPPVDTDFFVPARDQSTHGHYLLVSSLVPYKRVDLAVRAFNRLRKPLLVIGDGSERRRLEQQARPNVVFLGPQPADVLRRAMQSCRAFVFPAEEDFGIVMAEAQACGRPVIAFGRGGGREIVQEGVSGVLFDEQNVDALSDAVIRFEQADFDPAAIRASSLRFSKQRFLSEFARFVEWALNSRGDSSTGFGARSHLAAPPQSDRAFPRFPGGCGKALRPNPSDPFR
ncbi:MAG: glycosyltransferase [Acidobacteriia bacterium]|nr:glycosyltransferase [Terriglobia bacterium]